MGDQPRHPAASHVPTPRLVFGNPGTRLFPDFQELRQMTLRLSCASRRPSATPAGNHNGNPGLHFLSPLDSKVSPRCYQLGPDPTRVIQGGLIERKQFAFENTYVTIRWSWGFLCCKHRAQKSQKFYAGSTWLFLSDTELVKVTAERIKCFLFRILWSVC